MIVSTVDPTKQVVVSPDSPPLISVSAPAGLPGPRGPRGLPGEDAQWDRMTQAEYNALPTKDPNTLYVIIG